ncbi:MAG: 30S ribosomal protein S4e [Candidatus Aenigmarchaeota archaeon]|nr:30S ribosomal protein S4e [Candidatus Aenigmarchaeota archaeon]MBU5688951.1 30S ribosomal protein S4e [Candidatus Aenigmarchaeota archaeon]
MSRHMKTFNAPKFYRVSPKSRPWIVKPLPGPHPKRESIPLAVVLRDILKICDDLKDAKKIIKSGEIFVDGRVRKNYKFGVGLMDVISFKTLGKNYRVVMSTSGLKLIEIPKNEANLKLCRINRKIMIRGKKIQLGTHDGRSILANKDFNTGDSVLIELPSQKIIEHLKMEKGNLGLITGGENTGKFVKIKSVKRTRSREPNKVVCDLENREIDAVKDDVFVVGKDKPRIKLE